MGSLLPGYEQVYGSTPRGTAYRLDVPWRIVLHNIQGYTSSLASFRSLSSRHANGPHLWVDPRAGKRWKLQTVPLDKSARALAHPRGTPETNHARALQVEIAGYAEQTHTWSNADLDWIGEEVVAPLVRFVREQGSDIDLDYVERTYGSFEGIVLASVSSPIRHDRATWYGCDWVTTHQRVVANSHWDCGKLNLARVLSAAKSALGESPAPPPPPPPTPDPEEITVAEADRIIQELSNHIDGKVLGLMSFGLANQKTGVIWRVDGTQAPWYGRDGDGTYLLDFDMAVQFKALHEITENSVVISQQLHDAITASTTVVNLSGKSVDEIVEEVSETDGEFINGLIESSAQRVADLVIAQMADRGDAADMLDAVAAAIKAAAEAHRS